MRSVLVQLDDNTYRALNKVAPSAQGKRIEFIRAAIKAAIRREEYRKIRRAYDLQPDSIAEVGDWSDPEEFKA